MKSDIKGQDIVVNHITIGEVIQCNRENCYYDGWKNIYKGVVIVEKV